MAIQWFNTGRRGRETMEGDFFSLTNNGLRFSDEAWEKYFKRAPYLELGFDIMTNCIYLRGTQDQGYKVLCYKTKGNKNRESPNIGWVGFLKFFKLYFHNRLSVKIKEQGGILTLDLKNKPLV